MLNFQIVQYRNTPQEDAEIISLLTRVFVGEGYTDRLVAEKMFEPSELKKRGEIILARSGTSLVGMVIFVQHFNSARQVAKTDEAEIHLLAVYPQARNQGVASALILGCERRAILSGYAKMVLSTQKTMKSAHRLYEKHGYHRNSNRDWEKHGKSYYVYEKLLK